VAKSRLRQPNDNDHALVRLLRERMEQYRPMAQFLSARAILSASMVDGNQWRSAPRGGDNDVDPLLRVSMNLIGPIVQNYAGRHYYTDWKGRFTSAYDEVFGKEGPALNDKISACQDFYTHWECLSQFELRHRDKNLRRIVTGTTAGSWVFADDPLGIRRENGMRLTEDADTMIVMDPKNKVPEIDRHTWVIEVQVLTVKEANRLYGSMFKEKGRELTDGIPYNALSRSDAFVSQAIGSYSAEDQMSNSPSVLVYTMYDSHYTRPEQHHPHEVLLCPREVALAQGFLPFSRCLFPIALLRGGGTRL